MTFERSKSKTNIIFEILGPKNLILDTHELKIDTYEILASQRSFGGQYVTSEGSKFKTNVIFENLGPKNLFLYTHELKIDTLKF